MFKSRVNFAGPVYATYEDATLVAQLGIKETDKVLDVGGGSKPFTRADVVTEAYPEDGAHRANEKVVGPIVECTADNMPFKDKEFDFVICRHVLEHVVDPEAACKELMRVGKKGFIECPSEYTAYLIDYPAHRWLVYKRGAKLVFERKRWVFNPFRNAIKGAWFGIPQYIYATDVSYRNISNTQLCWSDTFEFEVIDYVDQAYDYDDKNQASMSHLEYGLNGLRYGDIPMGVALDQIEIAYAFNPSDPIIMFYKGLAMNKLYPGSGDWYVDSAKLLDTRLAEVFSVSVNDSIPLLTQPPPEFTGRNFYGLVYPVLKGQGHNLRTMFGLPADLPAEEILEISPEQIIEGSTHFNAPTVPLDKKFKFSLVTGMLERAADVNDFISKLRTVSDEGLIEVPSHMLELWGGVQDSKWLFHIEDKQLCFEEKPYDKAPFAHIIETYCKAFPAVDRAFNLEYRNIARIQFRWRRV